MTGRLALLLLVFVAGAAPAETMQWRSEAEGSQLAFSATFDGVAFDGGFGQFTVALEADDGALASARLTVSVAMASVDSRNAERDAALADPEWFATASHPEARYVAGRFEAIGDGTWHAEGELTLKGITRALPLRFTLTALDGGSFRLAGEARLAGETTIDRVAFDVGTGEWSDPGLIGHEVLVSFDVRLVPSGS